MASNLDDLAQRVARGRTDLVFDLLDAGASPDHAVGGTPLLAWCAYFGDVSAMRRLISGGARLEVLGPNLDLNGAAFHHHWQLCQFLIEQGADPDFALEETGETALHAALCRVGRLRQEKVVRVLIERGADPNARSAPHAETVGFARDARTRGEAPLHRAAAFADANTVRRLLEAGADPELRDAYGDTPLTWASWHLRPSDILRLLLHGEHTLHPGAEWTGDHGQGLSRMDQGLVGEP